MSWFVDAFGERYRQLYAHRDAAEAARVLDVLIAPGELQGRPALDLACGGGRYLAELIRRGARAVGVDLSTTLLREARRTLGRGAVLLRADMRQLPFADRRFDMTLSMFTSFGYFETSQEHVSLAQEMGRVTRRTLLVDVANPAALRRDLLPESERRLGALQVKETRWLESAPARVCKRIEISDPATGELRERYEERVMLFERGELERMFSLAGFHLERAWGDYDGGPYDHEHSPRILLRLSRGHEANP